MSDNFWEITAIQAIRLLGELRQMGFEFNASQYEELEEVTDLAPEDVDDIMDRASDLWDEIKDHVGHNAPKGQHDTAGLIALVHQRMQEEELA